MIIIKKIFEKDVLLSSMIILCIFSIHSSYVMKTIFVLRHNLGLRKCRNRDHDGDCDPKKF